MTEAPRFGRFSLFGLLLALLLPTMAALLAFDSWNDYQAMRRMLRDAYDQALLEPVQALDNNLTTGVQGELQISQAFSILAMFETTHARHKYLRVSYHVGEHVEMLMGSPGLPDAPDAPDGVPVFYDAQYRDEPVRIAALRRTMPLPDGSITRIVSQAAESVGLRTQAQTDLWHQALWSGLRILAVLAALVWLGITWGLHPLRRLRRSLQERPTGDLHPIETNAVPAEVIPLVQTINHHIASQRALLDEQTRFLADASHQLRTPLAIMLTQASYALRQHTAHAMRESLQAIVTQLARARRLSDQLLALAHARHAPDAEAPDSARVDLNALAREVVLAHLPLAREKQQDLGWIDAHDPSSGESDTDAAPVVTVRANAAQLQEALSNLLHNAIRYTPTGGCITVAARRERDHAFVEVLDNGPGIPATERTAVFERFRRGTHPPGENGGAGLGLAIAQAYAQRNGGTVTLEAGPGDIGLRAVLLLTMDDQSLG